MNNPLLYHGNKLVITTRKYDKDDARRQGLGGACESDESLLSEQGQTCHDVIG